MSEVVSTLDSTIDSLENIFTRERNERIFLVAMVLLLVAYSYMTVQLERLQSATAPAIMLGIMFVALVLIAIDRHLGGAIEDSLAIGGTYDSADDDDEDDGPGVIYEIEGRPIAKEFAYLIGYVLSLVYIGFFTTNFFFAFGYILFKETITAFKRRVIIAIIWSTSVVLLMFLLFDVMLVARLIWNLGFLP